MEESRFGRLVRVSLEEMWKGDGREFLAWLSRSENLSYLGEVVGMHLELDSLTEEQDRQDPILLCHDRASNSRFVIMSPVVVTEDSEFGRIIVYASQFDQVQLVLMAGRFQDGHLKAMKWFNRVTSGSVSLFGLEVDFWRIGNSPLAPNFNPVVVPASTTGGRPENRFSEPAGMQRVPERPPSSPPPVRPIGSPQRQEAPPPQTDSIFLQKAPEPVTQRPFPSTQKAEDPDSGQGTAESESPVTPSGMRRMFSSRGFSKSITDNLSAEPKPPSPESSEPVRHDSVVETSPIGRRREQTTKENGGDGRGSTINPDDKFDLDGEGQSSSVEWPESEATVTPSGMLQRFRVRDSQSLDPTTTSGDKNGRSPDDLYIEFWEQFWVDVIRWDDEPPPEKSMAQGWISFPIGRDHFSLVAFLNQAHSLAGMGLVIDGPEAKSHYQHLFHDKAAIESELGLSLDWRELPDKQESHIYLHRRNVDVGNRANWSDYQNWFADSMEAFMGVFGNRIDSLGSSVIWGE
jgi:Domain of unknown function (DUF4268)